MFCYFNISIEIYLILFNVDNPAFMLVFQLLIVGFHLQNPKDRGRMYIWQHWQYSLHPYGAKTQEQDHLTFEVSE
jgi:hypothetical protein